jgi:proton-coupled amino acid transporter
LIIGVLNYYTMMLQVNCKLKLGGAVETYSDLAMKTYGPKGKFIVDFCLYTSQLGACIAYLLFVGKQFDQVICYESGGSSLFCGNKNQYIIMAALLLIPICCMRTFKFISYMSAFATVTICFASKDLTMKVIICVVGVIVVDSINNAQENPSQLRNLKYFQIEKLPVFFGIAVFAFEGNGVIQSLHNSMKEPEKFEPVLRILMAVIISIVASVGTIAYCVRLFFTV